MLWLSERTFWYCLDQDQEHNDPSAKALCYFFLIAYFLKGKIII